jgi:hypothetical protein
MVASNEEYIQQEAVRQAINSPVQEFGSTLGVIALGRMNLEVDPQYLQIIGFIHDAIYAYVKCEYLTWGLKILGYYMESAPIQEWFNYDMQIPIKSDPSFGINMGDVIELEDFPRAASPTDHVEYDWTHDCMKGKDGNLMIEVPPQETPPNDGMLSRSTYTLPTDLEDESVVLFTSRKRRALQVSSNTTKREEPKATKRVGRTRAPEQVVEEPTAKRVRRTR